MKTPLERTSGRGAGVGIPWLGKLAAEGVQSRSKQRFLCAGRRRWQSQGLCKEPGNKHIRSRSLQRRRVMQGGAGTGVRLHRGWSGKASSKVTPHRGEERSQASVCRQSRAPGGGSRAARAQQARAKARASMATVGWGRRRGLGNDCKWWQRLGVTCSLEGRSDRIQRGGESSGSSFLTWQVRWAWGGSRAAVIWAGLG